MSILMDAAKGSFKCCLEPAMHAATMMAFWARPLYLPDFQLCTPYPASSSFCYQKLTQSTTFSLMQ
jgi:hypothetical protein